MDDEINAYRASRSGEAITYAAPGRLVTRVYDRTKTPTSWHRFIIWDRDTEELQADRLRRVARWCADNAVRAPSFRFICGCGYPIFVATASANKATLFKLTFGGAA